MKSVIQKRVEQWISSHKDLEEILTLLADAATAHQDRIDIHDNLIDGIQKSIDSGASLSRSAKRPLDDPSTDGTDFAHPAWWRGQDDGVRGTCERINKELDSLNIPRGSSNSLDDTLSRIRSCIADNSIWVPLGEREKSIRWICTVNMGGQLCGKPAVAMYNNAGKTEQVYERGARAARCKDCLAANIPFGS